MTGPDFGTVTVSMPYHRCPGTLRRAVESVLAQTYRDVRVVVVNDGDHPPWRLLHGITDPRLTCFDLPVNRGRYYADAVTLAACDNPWWAICDTDDWVEPHWLASMLTRARETGAGAVFGPQWIHHLGRSVKVEPVGPLLERPGPVLRQLAHHAGLYRTAVAREAGGPHPGFRVGYDTLFVNLVAMVATVACIDRPAYHRVARRDSLTRAPATGFGSILRTVSKARLEDLYTAALASGDPGRVVRATIPVDLAASVQADADRLRKELT